MCPRVKATHCSKKSSCRYNASGDQRSRTKRKRGITGRGHILFRSAVFFFFLFFLTGFWFFLSILLFYLFQTNQYKKKIRQVCKSHTEQSPGMQKNSRVKSKYTPGTREAKFSLGKVKKCTGSGFTGSDTEGCSVLFGSTTRQPRRARSVLESPGNFSGTELYFKIKIYRMVVARLVL